jgi:hypothetical protein
MSSMIRKPGIAANLIDSKFTVEGSKYNDMIFDVVIASTAYTFLLSAEPGREDAGSSIIGPAKN